MNHHHQDDRHTIKPGVRWLVVSIDGMYGFERGQIIAQRRSRTDAMTAMNSTGISTFKVCSVAEYRKWMEWLCGE